jgi:hypothetical protein
METNTLSAPPPQARIGHIDAEMAAEQAAWDKAELAKPLPVDQRRRPHGNRPAAANRPRPRGRFSKGSGRKPRHRFQAVPKSRSPPDAAPPCRTEGGERF